MATRTAKAPDKTKRKRNLHLPGSVVGWLNKDQVCLALGGCTPRFLDKLIAAGRFPRGDKNLGRNPRWTVAMINEWCAQNTLKGEDK